MSTAQKAGGYREDDALHRRHVGVVEAEVGREGEEVHRESGSRGRGVGESGSRESGSRGVGESGSRGVGESKKTDQVNEAAVLCSTVRCFPSTVYWPLSSVHPPPFSGTRRVESSYLPQSLPYSSPPSLCPTSAPPSTGPTPGASNGEALSDRHRAGAPAVYPPLGRDGDLLGHQPDDGPDPRPPLRRRTPPRHRRDHGAPPDQPGQREHEPPLARRLGPRPQDPPARQPEGLSTSPRRTSGRSRRRSSRSASAARSDLSRKPSPTASAR